MKSRIILVCIGGVVLLAAGIVASAYPIVLHADADAHVHPQKTTSGGSPVAAWYYNYGSSTTLSAGGYYDNHKVVYLHFDLASAVRRRVMEARLKLDRSSHGWTGSGDSTQSIEVFGLMNDADEWDPLTNPEGTGTGQDTPEPDVVGSNAPARGPNGPVLNDEGTAVSAASRRLAQQSCNRNTTPNEGYSIDVDVTDFINWALHKDDTFSTYTNQNNDITIAIHLQYRGSYPYLMVSWQSTEYTTNSVADDPRLELEYPPGGTVVIFR